MKRKLKLYAVVTNDIYELPLCIGTINECAEYAGVKPSSMKCMMSRIKSGERLGTKMNYQVVPLGMYERIKA